MGDGKALQMGTSHELGQNFARAFDIDFLDADGTEQLAWTTSWGVSTRMIGGLIMAHGDDAGLRVPPRLAPIQVVVLAGPRRGRRGRARPACIADELRDRRRAGRSSTTAPTRRFGRRATDWELKGVPVRVEVGPRDLANGAGHRWSAATPARRPRSPLGRPVRRASPTLLDAGPGRPARRGHRRRATTAPSTSPPLDEAREAGPHRASPACRWSARRRRRRGRAGRRRRSPSAASSAPTARVPDDASDEPDDLVARAVARSLTWDLGRLPAERSAAILPGGSPVVGDARGVGSGPRLSFATEPLRARGGDRRGHDRARPRPRRARCVAELGLELVDVEHTGGILRVTVDRAGRRRPRRHQPRLTRRVSRLLDEHDPVPGRYTLEVSSPGLERPLRTPAHFRRAVGAEVTVKTRRRRRGRPPGHAAPSPPPTTTASPSASRPTTPVERTPRATTTSSRPAPSSSGARPRSPAQPKPTEPNGRRQPRDEPNVGHDGGPRRRSPPRRASPSTRCSAPSPTPSSRPTSACPAPRVRLGHHRPRHRRDPGLSPRSSTRTATRRRRARRHPATTSAASPPRPPSR